MRALFAMLVLTPFALLAQSARIEVGKVNPLLIQQRLEAVRARMSERRDTLLALFREAGCDGDRLTTQKAPGSPNLICMLPGEDPALGTIVVGGHYDKVEHGMGAVDDWSGAVLLPSLYQALASRPRQHRYIFVAFAAEESGLEGSTVYVKSLPKPPRSTVRAMINLECLGVSTPKIWATRADKQLAAAYAAVANSIGVQPEGMSVDKVGDDDSHPFLNAGIPVLTIHSINSRNLSILHSGRDTVKAIDPTEYYDAFRVASTYLAYLDTFLKAE